MATKTNIRFEFIKKLLAPLPGDEEQADTPKFRKIVEKDMMRVWRAGMKSVEIASAHHAIAADAFNKAGESMASSTTAALANHEAYKEVRAAKHAQCLIAAPTPVQLRWKQKAARVYHKVPQDIQDAISRDQRRFAEMESGEPITVATSAGRI